jgi:hypothetical protein
MAIPCGPARHAEAGIAHAVSCYSFATKYSKKRSGSIEHRRIAMTPTTINQ